MRQRRQDQIGAVLEPDGEDGLSPERTAAAGFDAHLVKPVTFEALERAVASLPFPRNAND